MSSFISQTSLCRNFGPLFFKYCFSSLRFGEFVSFSAILLHVCLCALGSPACCISQFGPSFICWIGGLPLMCHSMIARCPGPVPATQARSISSPPLCWQLMFGFQMWHCALCPNMSILLSAQNKPLLFSQLHWHEPQHLAGCRVWGVAFLFIFLIFCWDVHSWDDCQLSWKSSCEWPSSPVEYWITSLRSLLMSWHRMLQTSKLPKYVPL